MSKHLNLKPMTRRIKLKTGRKNSWIRLMNKVIFIPLVSTYFHLMYRNEIQIIDEGMFWYELHALLSSV